MTAKFTTEQTLEWLDQAVAERGADFNYREHFGRSRATDLAFDVRDHVPAQTCRYVEFDDNGEATVPGCIAGLVFHYAGIPLDTLRSNESNSAEGVARSLGFDVTAAIVLQRAQRRQDSGHTWGEAVAAAKEMANALAKAEADRVAYESGKTPEAA